MRKLISCVRCKKTRPHGAEQLCRICYHANRYRTVTMPAPEPPTSCANCGKKRPLAGERLCGDCRQRKLRSRPGHHRHVGAQTEKSLVVCDSGCGLPLATLALPSSEQEKERRRRARIYARHIEQYGEIRWGEVAPASGPEYQSEEGDDADTDDTED